MNGLCISIHSRAWICIMNCSGQGSGVLSLELDSGNWTYHSKFAAMTMSRSSLLLKHIVGWCTTEFQLQSLVVSRDK